MWLPLGLLGSPGQEGLPAVWSPENVLRGRFWLILGCLRAVLILGTILGRLGVILGAHALS